MQVAVRPPRPGARHCSALTRYNTNSVRALNGLRTHGGWAAALRQSRRNRRIPASEVDRFIAGLMAGSE